MAEISIINNQPSNGNYKTWKERKQKKPTCWSVSHFLFCLRWSVYVFCTMSSTFHHIHVVVPFSMNRKATNVGFWSDIKCLTSWTTSFYSCRLAFKKTLTSSSFVSLNHQHTMHKFWLCTFHWRGWKILRKSLPHSTNTVFDFFLKISSYIVNYALVMQLSYFFFFAMEWSTLMHFSTSFSSNWYSTTFCKCNYWSIFILNFDKKLLEKKLSFGVKQALYQN